MLRILDTPAAFNSFFRNIKLSSDGQAHRYLDFSSSGIVAPNEIISFHLLWSTSSCNCSSHEVNILAVTRPLSASQIKQRFPGKRSKDSDQILFIVHCQCQGIRSNNNYFDAGNLPKASLMCAKQIRVIAHKHRNCTWNVIWWICEHRVGYIRNADGTDFAINFSISTVINVRIHLR